MNQVFTLPGQPQMQAEVILASSSDNSKPIYTIRGRLPRIIWPECLTHRDLNRNGRSSRAVPAPRMIQEVKDSPFIPWHWGRNQKGMQADEECDELLSMRLLHPKAGGRLGRTMHHTRSGAWLSASETAVEAAEAFAEAGYHKQIVNRLLEPFMWIDVLITATEWENFFWLRDHKDAEPHLQDFARLVKQALDGCEVQHLEPGEWHLPYITLHDRDVINSACGLRGEDPDIRLRKISAARCARISYAPFDDDASYERELERYESLVSSDRIHASPLEHQATPDWVIDKKAHEIFGNDWKSPELHGNTPGWIQHRKLIPGEVYRAEHP